MATVRRALGFGLIVVLALVLFGGGWLMGRLGIGAIVDPASLTDLERQLAERMRAAGTMLALPWRRIGWSRSPDEAADRAASGEIVKSEERSTAFHEQEHPSGQSSHHARVGAAE